jgi:hypothetical protein
MNTLSRSALESAHVLRTPDPRVLLRHLDISYLPQPDEPVWRT